ncbi:hypothetical protein [Rhodopila sp.]|uniref:hypothetical protein n=1 Tax=Rhodopila sp. TaxID=2480087 RepID=UPI003D12E4E6
MELSENLKLNLDSASGGTSPDPDRRPLGAESPTVSEAADAHAQDSGPSDDAESQMRKALGLIGESQRNRLEPERMDQTARMGDRFNGGLHRRRFVQDGDVPVTVLRREPGHEAPAHRGVAPPTGPTSSRLQRTEAALGAETAARDRAERSLAETQGIVRDLQTKIGHAELAKNEAIEALRRERETLGLLRAEVASHQGQLREALEQLRSAERDANLHQDHLVEERNARRIAEKALRMAETARDSSEQLVRALSEESPSTDGAAETAQADAGSESLVFGTSQRRGRQAETAGMEPEPVKWWLNTKPSGKKR